MAMRFLFDKRALLSRADKPAWRVLDHQSTKLHAVRFLAVIRAPYLEEKTWSFEESLRAEFAAN